MALQFPDVNTELVEKIVDKLKSQGIFDQFRKDCLADVDSRPAYQNLRDKVNGAVADFLSKQSWTDDLNKNQLRESLRKHVEQHYLEVGVNKIVEQVVNPKIFSVFMPKVEEVVYQVMGIEKPPNLDNRNHNRLRYLISGDLSQSPTKMYSEILPSDLDPVSPVNTIESGNESGKFNDSITSKATDELDNTSRDVNKESNLDVNEASNESKVSGISELSSHGSTTKLDISESAYLPGDKSEINSIINNLNDRSNLAEGDKSKIKSDNATGGYDFDNFSNLKEKLMKADPLNKNVEKERSDKTSSEENVIFTTNDSNELASAIKGTTVNSAVEEKIVLKSPIMSFYSEDSVGSASSLRVKSKMDKVFCLNESTRNSIAMDCDNSSVSFIEKKFEEMKEADSVSCIESFKEESQTSVTSGDSRKFNSFANFKLKNENSRESSPDSAKSDKKNEEEENRSSMSSHRINDNYDSKHNRSRHSSRDKKYSKDYKSRNESDSKNYSSNSRDKHSSRSKDERHRSDLKSNKKSYRDMRSSDDFKKESRHSSYEDKYKKDRDSKRRSRDDSSSRHRSKDLPNNSDDDKRSKQLESKTLDYKDKDSRIDKKDTTPSRKDDSKKVFEDNKNYKKEDSRYLKDKSSKSLEEDKYSRKDSKKYSDDYKNSRSRDKKESTSYKDSKSISHDRKSSSSKSRSAEDDRSSKKENKNSKSIEEFKISGDKSSKSDKNSFENADRDKRKTPGENAKKEDKDSKRKKRENCSEDIEKKEIRRSRDRDEGGHKDSGKSSRDQKEKDTGDSKRNSSSAKQEKAASSNGSSKGNSTKESDCVKDRSSQMSYQPECNIIEESNIKTENDFNEIEDDFIEINNSSDYICIDNSENDVPLSETEPVRDLDTINNDNGQAEPKNEEDLEVLSKEDKIEETFNGFNQEQMDISCKKAEYLENYINEVYSCKYDVDLSLSDVTFPLTDNNLNNIDFKNVSNNFKECQVMADSSCNSNIFSIEKNCNQTIVTETVEVITIYNDSNQADCDLNEKTDQKVNDVQVEVKTIACVLNEEQSKTSEEIKSNEDRRNICESSSSERCFTLPTLTEDMLDNFMMENIDDKNDGCYNSSDSDAEGCVVSINSEPIAFSETNNESSTEQKEVGEISEDIPTTDIISSETDEERLKEEKITSPRTRQRYSEGDLYKPRPLISNPSRRNRVSSKNGSKPSRGTKRSVESMEFSENKRPR